MMYLFLINEGFYFIFKKGLITLISLSYQAIFTLFVKFSILFYFALINDNTIKCQMKNHTYSPSHTKEKAFVKFYKS